MPLLLSAMRVHRQQAVLRFTTILAQERLFCMGLLVCPEGGAISSMNRHR